MPEKNEKKTVEGILRKELLSGNENFDNEHILPRIYNILTEIRALSLSEGEIYKAIKDVTKKDDRFSMCSEFDKKLAKAIFQKQSEKMCEIVKINSRKLHKKGGSDARNKHDRH